MAVATELRESGGGLDQLAACIRAGKTRFRGISSHHPEVVQAAITATAHKLARLIYSMLRHGTEYVDAGQDYYEREYQDRVVRNLTRRAKELGFVLVPEAVETAVT